MHTLAEKKAETIVDEIKTINPDKIFFMTQAEVDGDYIFKEVIDKINTWLKENNKFITVIIPNPDGRKYNDNVITGSYYGWDLNNSNWLKSLIEENTKLNIDTVDKFFTCYMNNARVHRYQLIDNLILNNLINDGYVTYILPHIHHDDLLRTLEGYKLKAYNFEKYTDEADFVLNTKPEFGAVNIPRSYLKGFVDIVAESRYLEGELYLSEKTARPLGTLKPFLVCSSRNFHSFLVERYDLELYTELFDYSFDSDPVTERRVQGIIENLSRVKKLFEDRNKLKEIYNNLLPKMLRNRQKLINVIDNKEKMIPKSLTFLTEITDYNCYGDGLKIPLLQLFVEKGWISHIVK